MKRPEEIENDIEQTRGAMSGTLQAIERKLSPNRLVDEAMDTMRKMTMTDSGLVGLARDNPVPVALVGLGLGWLALSSLRGSSHSLAAAIEDTVDESSTLSADKAEEWAGYGADGGNGATRRLAAKARERAGDVAQNLGETAREWTEATRSGVAGLGRRLSQGVGRQAEDLADVFQDHPLTVGLVALVAGVALGAAIPRTRRETELLGDSAAELLASARETGRQAIQKAGRVVQRAAEAVSEGGSETVKRTKEAVSNEVRRQAH